MNNVSSQYVYVLLVCAALIVTVGGGASPAKAETHATSVKSSISVSSNTGGNSASAGAAQEGKATADVFIETTVNGEVVEYVNEHYENTNGEGIIINKQSNFEIDSGGAGVETSIRANAQSGSVAARAGADTAAEIEHPGTKDPQDTDILSGTDGGGVNEENTEDAAPALTNDSRIASADRQRGLLGFLSQIIHHVFSIFFT